MAVFLDKNEKRDLEILYHLYSEDKFWPAEELAKTVNCSVASIYNSISILNELILSHEVDCWIQIEKHSGIKIHTSSYASVYYLECLYIQQTVTYQLLTKLFHGQARSIDQLQEEFYLSRSTIYRKLLIIEKFLNQNGFSFSKNDMVIIGSESSIREFFYLFYISLADEHTWPFLTVSYNDLEENLAKIVERASLKLSYPEKLRSIYRMAVNAVRFQQNRYIAELPEIVQIAPNLAFELNDVKELLLEKVPDEHIALEFRSLSLTYLTYSGLLDIDETVGIEEAVWWNRTQRTKAYELVADLLKRMADTYPKLEVSNQFSSPVLIYQLLAIANYSLLYPELDVDIDINDRWNKRFRSLTYSSLDHPKFTEVLWRLISSIHDENNGILINPHHVFYYIYSIFSQNFDLRVFEESLKIKLIMEVGNLSENDLKEKLSCFLTYNVEIVTSTTRHDEDVAYDLIISDLSHLVVDYSETKHQYIWAFPPTTRDWQAIKQIVETLQLRPK